MKRLISLGAIAALFFMAITPAAAQQPLQWNYSFVNDVATATYPGNVVNSGSTVQTGSLYLRSNSAVLTFGALDDVQLSREAANILALRRSTNAQGFHVYNTADNLSPNTDYERGVFDWTTNANVLTIGAANGGTGVGRGIAFMVTNTRVWNITALGHLTAQTDNAYDIGASGANRPRSVFVGTAITAGTTITAGTALVATTSATAGTFMKSGVTTVVGLGTCNAGAAGQRWMVNDSNAAASGNYAAAVAAGGANVVPVYCDGTSWKIGANDNFARAERYG